MQNLELNGFRELSQLELVNTDGGELVNAYSNASASSAGKALSDFFSGFYSEFSKQIKNCNCF